MSWGRMGNGWGEVRVNGRVIRQRGRGERGIKSPTFKEHWKFSGQICDGITKGVITLAFFQQQIGSNFDFSTFLNFRVRKIYYLVGSGSGRYVLFRYRRSLHGNRVCSLF